MSGYCLPWADIDWASQTTPYAPQVNDIYWSRDQGPGEKQHVFVEGNQLPARVTNLERHHLTIAEVGFGFGLNFLLTVRLWRRQAHDHARLNYVAIERSPVSPADLERCLAGEFAADAATLIERYPLPAPGWHLIEFEQGISLILGLGDAAALLADLDGTIDAWFLDGFSPRMNPDAWSPAIFDAMREHSRPGATFSTYSVAGDVRRGASDAGFAVDRAPGYGTKAEMLTGRFPGTWQPQAYPARRVAIIGAGIAGYACARSLAARNIEATLFDRHPAPLSGASGAPAFAVYPQLPAAPEPAGLLSLAAFNHARQHYRTLAVTGRVQLAENAAASERLAQTAELLPSTFAEYLEAHPVSAKLGIDCRHPGLWLADAGIIEVAREYAEPFDFQGDRAVTGIRDRVLQWDTVEATFDAIIIASGHEELAVTRPLARVPVRGQSLVGRIDPAPTASVGGPVSILPLGDGRAVIGSTYQQHETDRSLRDAESLSLAASVSSCLDATFEPEFAWTGIRSSTRDRQPIAGAMPDWQQLDLWCESAAGDEPFDGWVPGLFILTGLGSHGATTAPLLAESVVRQITGEAGCLGLAAAGRLNPARFKLRDAGRRREVTALRPRRPPER